MDYSKIHNPEAKKLKAVFPSPLIIALQRFPLEFICLNPGFYKTWRRLLLLIFSLFIKTLLYSQPNNTKFIPVEPEKFSNSFVRCTFKDSRGFIWFGMSTGLARYDGTNIKMFEHDPNDNTTLCHNNINAIIEDNNHNIWVGTSKGLNLYNREKDNFINVDAAISKTSNHLNNSFITSLGSDSQNNIWVGTLGGGVNVYDIKTSKFTYFLENNKKELYVPADYITSLLFDGHQMWAGTRAGIKLYDTYKMKLISPNNIDKNISNKQIACLTKDKLGNIWIGTSLGEICELKMSENHYFLKTFIQQKNIFGSGNILDLCSDKHNNLWIVAESSGVSYLDARTKKLTQYLPEEGNPHSLGSSSAWSVYCDNADMVWVGTLNKGVYRIDNNSKGFESYQQNVFKPKGLTGNDIRGFAEDGNGNIWIAVDGSGLNKFNIKKREFVSSDLLHSKLADKSVMALICDSDKNLWVGTWGGGVNKINGSSLDLKNYKVQSTGIGNNKILCIYEDKLKNIWVGTSGSGLFYFSKKLNRFILLSEDNKKGYIPKTAYVTSILEATDGTLWVGTLYGLHALKSTGEHSYEYVSYYQDNKPGSISSSGIQTIYEDEQKNLWFGTTDNGLNFLRRGASDFKVFLKKDGLPSNTIRGTLSDRKGNIWVSSNSGLSKFNPRTNSFKNYTKEDGLNSNEFYFGSCIRTTSGEFFFGSEKGFNVFYPDSIKDNPFQPVMCLTELRINNQPMHVGVKDSPLKKHISLTNSITLPFDQRSFSIDFVAIDYGQSSRNQYCYKLDGFEENWNFIGSNHTAVYTNIDPGHYVFQVKGSNSNGHWSKVPAQLEITIYPPLWRTWWAILIYILTLTSVIFLLLKIRIERINIKNQLNMERLAREKEYELSESKTQFFTNISHEFRTPLSLIIMPLESMVSSLQVPSNIKDRLFTAYKNAEKMLRLVNEIMDFNKLDTTKLKLNVQSGEIVKFITEVASSFDDISKRRNISLKIQSEAPTIFGWYDYDKLEKILLNVLSNAFKFTSDNGQISIIINCKNLPQGKPYEQRTNENNAKHSHCLEVVIIDNGVGISSEEIPYIFDKFYQAKSAAKVTNTGSGIGLSLAKGLIELHHGSIVAESILNLETRFTLTIPIDRDVYKDEDLYESPIDILVNKIENSREEDLRKESDYTKYESKGISEILIVEDNDELRKYLVSEFNSEYSVIEAKDGQEGIDMAFERIPDLIISDIMMPRKTGVELCKEIKSDLRTSHIPTILLTAKTTIEDQIEGIETGADVYITKPFSIRFLIAHVKQIIDTRRKLYSLFSQDVYLLPGKITDNEIDQAFLQKIIDYILQNILNTQLGVESVAHLFHISRTQVYRKIKALTGKTAVEFIRTIRLKKALSLMQTGKYTVAEIAYQTGFSSPSYFSRSFKEQYGKAPSEYILKPEHY